MVPDSKASPKNAGLITAKERYDQGKSLQEKVPFDRHADWSVDDQRANPVDLIEEQNEDRIPWLVPVRRSRMSASTFAFYRGSARIMAHDLSKTPVSGIQTQICGDAHLANFGVYASPERQLVFDLNDFDETLPGPWEWDLKRLAASFIIACRHNGFSAKDSRIITQSLVHSYRKSIDALAKMRLSEIWYSLVKSEDIFARAKKRKTEKSAKKSIKKAKTKDNQHALDRLAEKYEGQFRIRSEKPLLVPLRDMEHKDREEIRALILDNYNSYLESIPHNVAHLLNKYEPIDFGLKVVGVGSVGTLCSIILLKGRDRKDPFFLQIKQANKSVLEEYLPSAGNENYGERVVKGQRLMQTVSDIFLGWTYSEATDHHYYFRQLKDWKGSGDLENTSKKAMQLFADLQARTLARAHARSGDPVMLSGYLQDGKKFDKAITVFAEKYADQTVKDYQAFVDRIEGEKLEISEL